MNLRLPVLLSLLGAISCKYSDPDPFTAPETFVGKQVAPEVLEHGRDSYVRHCLACHGWDGDGRGPASPGLRPPPRDFRIATFKFGGVEYGSGMPYDEDLLNMVTSGLHGTAMLPWDVPEVEMKAIIHYIKTFSPEGTGWRDPDEELGNRIVADVDPWAGKEAEAVEYGEKVYHGFTTCQSCHPAYATKQEIWDYRAAFDAKADFRPDQYRSVPKTSDTFSVPYPGAAACETNKDCGDNKVCNVVGTCEAGATFVPPDFTWDKVRSARTGSEVPDLFRVISAGIPGTAMTAWVGATPGPDGKMGTDDDAHDIWALSHYVKSLMDLRDSAEATEMRTKMNSQPEFVPPPEPTEGDTGAPEGEGEAAEGAAAE